MKSYPSIPRSTGKNFQEFDAHVWDKLDGSNLRWEYAKKGGWYKQGTRTRLFDVSDPVFGEAIALFGKTLAEPLERVARNHRWDRLIVFTEFWGPRSLAGSHVTGEEKRLTLFDVNPHQKGFLNPSDFLRLFDSLDVPRYLGEVRWTRDYVERVRRGEVEGVTFEGVVGKNGGGHERIAAKAKTQAWIDKVLSSLGAENGAQVVDS